MDEYTLEKLGLPTKEFLTSKPKGIKMIRHIKYERAILFEDGTVYDYYFDNGVNWLYRCQMITI